jgi:hypothetical protein
MAASDPRYGDMPDAVAGAAGGAVFGTLTSGAHGSNASSNNVNSPSDAPSASLDGPPKSDAHASMSASDSQFGLC